MKYQGRNSAVTGGGSANLLDKARAPRLLDQVRACCRVRHYSLHRERAYVGWIRRFILANGKRHPRELGAAELGSGFRLLQHRHDAHHTPADRIQQFQYSVFEYRI